MTPDERFARCVALVLAHEGGATFTNDPADTGGPTRWGVTLKTLQSIRPNATEDDVRNLSEAEAASIFRAWYWSACACDKLPAGLDYATFDCAANQGITRARMFLQRALGVTADGQLGPQTMLAVRGCDPTAVIRAIRDLREAHYRSLSSFARFGVGWLRRVTEVTTTALIWAMADKPAEAA